MCLFLLPYSKAHRYAAILGHNAIDLLPRYKTQRRLQEREIAQRYINQKGEVRICGGKDLKESQAYPKGYRG